MLFLDLITVEKDLFKAEEKSVADLGAQTFVKVDEDLQGVQKLG